MGHSIASARLDGEVKPLHRDESADADTVRKLHRLPERAVTARAKAHVGAAVEQAIGDAPRKQFGHEGLLSEVCSGAKAPGYLARIYADPEARLRFGMAWLKGDPRVRIRTVIEIVEEDAA